MTVHRINFINCFILYYQCFSLSTLKEIMYPIMKFILNLYFIHKKQYQCHNIIIIVHKKSHDVQFL
jgi:hypothetical protein